MTVFHCEGFETIGDTGTSGSDVETRLGDIPDYTYINASGGHGGDPSLIDDFETEGYALQFPLGDAARGEFVTMEWPATYKVSTNASHPTMCCGFRFYNADLDPTGTATIWNNLVGSGTVQSSLAVASNRVDLTFTPSSGSATTISNVLTADTWHYIELEFKPAPSGSGGFITIYVDGSEVADLTSQSIASFTFFTSFGIRIGHGHSGGNVTTGQIAFDDIYQMELDGVEHTECLGPSRVLALFPDGDASPNDWTPSTGGDNFAMLDNEDWETSDYVEAVTTGDDDHYSLSTLGAADSVHGLQIDVLCEATDGTPNLHIGFDDGTADEIDGGTIATGGTTVVRGFFADDPSSAAWTSSSVNTVEATQRMTE